ncbi:hypothetical protein ACFFHT_00390 [Gallibacterium melopsittaci]|uniref:Uncharacterized protein n=2 Tax=Gallibacterium TaxID=155493 RepID=A0A1A7PTL6_9PAST|nr:hypothetical protein [Gallibacterium genomosp. 3]OBX05918.1 hypothetical protein QV06_00505 [Gallibacterium genomosp. 3]
MIKQPYRYKVVRQQKKRTNFFALEQRVTALERIVAQQQRMNDYLTSRNEIINLANESLLDRVEALEALHYKPTFLSWLFGKLGK